MKKNTKIILLVACALVLCGAVICVCAFAAVDFDMFRLSTPEDATREWHLETVPSEGIERIRVSASVDSIRVCSSGSDEINVTYYTSQYGSYELKNENGELSLEYIHLKNKKWYEYLTVDFSSLYSDNISVEIGIPAGYSGDVQIEATTGDMDLVNLELEGPLSARCTTGSIEIYDVSAASVEASVTTGDMELDRVTTFSDISVSYQTGEARLENVLSGGTIQVRGTTGDIDLYIIEANSITAECTTGCIGAYDISAADTYLKATTGEIIATMRGVAEDYTVSTSATLGEIVVADGGRANGEKRVCAETTTGEIYIGFADSK